MRKTYGRFGVLTAKGTLARAAAGLGLIILLGCLPGCAVNSEPNAPSGGEGGSFGPGYPAGSAQWTDGARSAYRTAFVAGRQDQREGYRYDDDRGAMRWGMEERMFYRQGYRRGYYRETHLRRLESKVENLPEVKRPDSMGN